MKWRQFEAITLRKGMDTQSWSQSSPLQTVYISAVHVYLILKLLN